MIDVGEEIVRKRSNITEAQAKMLDGVCVLFRHVHGINQLIDDGVKNQIRDQVKKKAEDLKGQLDALLSDLP